ncbi:MAG TPA: matrixin family metalloprotease [Steroidobacteraceae bacterium]|jgi:hypothetical protein
MSARAGRIVALFAGLAAAGVAIAGGPLAVRTNGAAYLWNTATAIQYRTDNGPLSASVTESAARSRVQAMFAVWQNVASASIAYNRTGSISSVAGFSGGDVNTAAEFDAVDGDCANGNQSPIVYDADATIFRALGVDETSIIGFAAPCALDPAQGRILTGEAVMNGLFQDGAANPVPDLTAAEFDATFVHEFGHFSGLDHSQVNVECATAFCGADDLAGLPTMFPFLVTAQQGTLSIDDVASISRLYPAGGGNGFNATHGTVTGIVYFSDGESHAQLVNVVARRVDNGGTAANESRTTAASGVSGNSVRVFNGNPINEPDDMVFGPFGSQDAADIGRYEISLPPGDYMIVVESIDPNFTGGSSVGGGGGGDPRFDMPGSAPAPLGPITVTAGQTSTGNDVILIGTPPRFDAFEGP